MKCQIVYLMLSLTVTLAAGFALGRLFRQYPAWAAGAFVALLVAVAGAVWWKWVR